jgi:hypothetical protein
MDVNTNRLPAMPVRRVLLTAFFASRTSLRVIVCVSVIIRSGNSSMERIISNIKQIVAMIQTTSFVLDDLSKRIYLTFNNGGPLWKSARCLALLGPRGSRLAVVLNLSRAQSTKR